MNKPAITFPLVSIFLALAIISCTKRKPEEIDYAPSSPYNPYPPDSSTNIDHTTTDVTLRWDCFDQNADTLSYTVYFDTLSPPIQQIVSDLPTNSFFIPGLDYNRTYYWKVHAKDENGILTTGPVWCFKTLPHANTAPLAPTYSLPPNGAVWQYPTLSLSWSATDPNGNSDTLYYDIYLSPSLPPAITDIINYASKTYVGSELLYSTTYNWKIVARDNHGAETSGPIYSFTTRDSPWFYKSDIPSPRYGFGTVAYNNKIYILGGTNGYNIYDDVFEYDLALDSWQKISTMPQPLAKFGAALYNDKIYIIGGTSSAPFDAFVMMFDPASNNWSQKAPLPFVTTGTAVTIGNNILFVTGDGNYITQYNALTDQWWDTTYYYYDTLWADTTHTAYDTTWVDTVNTYVKTFLPLEYNFFSVGSYNNRIYILGGSYWGKFYASVSIYDPVNNHWTGGADMPLPLSLASVVSTNDAVYVLGGWCGIHTKRVSKYDPASNTWQIRSDMQTARAFEGSAYINNRIYVLGGLNTLPLSSVEEYRLELDPKQ
jgi:N-acetylneuraminic acid mutarotase